MCVVGKHFRYVSYSSQQAKVEMMWACQNAETAHQQTPSSNSPILIASYPPIPPSNHPLKATTFYFILVCGCCLPHNFAEEQRRRFGRQRQWRNIKHLPLISISSKMMA